MLLHPDLHVMCLVNHAVIYLESKKVFKDKRKKHYNEFGNVKLARDLIAKELAELEDDE